MKKKFALIVLLVLISTPKVFAVCNTMVPPGVISGKTWTAAGSPYCVEGKITVNNLTIEPAVRVEFTGNFELEVVGVLTAVGTVGNSIIFTTTADNDDGWKGIYFNISLPGSEIAHVIIEKSVDSGLEINNSQPTIRDCTIRDNEQTSLNRGGGIWTNAPLTLNRCTVMDNSVSVVNGTVFGGGIYSESDLVLRDTSVLKNKASASAPYSPSSATAHGGGIYVEGTLKLERSVVDSNLTDARCAAGYTHAYSRGGGFYAMGKATILNSFITRNEAFGAGFCSYIRSGGGIYLEAEGELINSTVADNITEGLKDTIASVKVVNSIFWKNTVNQIAGSSDVSYSDVQGGWPGTGNIDLNLLFKTPDPADPMYDVHLDSFSPCIDKGTSTGAPNDDIDGDSRPQKSGFDMGADEVVVVEVLAYTPVTPCRIADTRKAGGAIAAGGIHSYNVWGPVASQGGNPVGCPSPKGEPRAVHVNVTSVPLGNGWITVYPYNSTAPTASLVNYRSDAQNVANSGTIKTCFNCAKDINIKSGGGTTHVIIDVLGYYYSKP